MNEPKCYSDLHGRIFEVEGEFNSLRQLKAISNGDRDIEIARIVAVEELATALDAPISNAGISSPGDFHYGLRVIAQIVGEGGLSDYGVFGKNIVEPLAKTFNERLGREEASHRVEHLTVTVAGETGRAYKTINLGGE